MSGSQRIIRRLIVAGPSTRLAGRSSSSTRRVPGYVYELAHSKLARVLAACVVAMPAGWPRRRTANIDNSCALAASRNAEVPAATSNSRATEGAPRCPCPQRRGPRPLLPVSTVPLYAASMQRVAARAELAVVTFTVVAFMGAATVLSLLPSPLPPPERRRR